MKKRGKRVRMRGSKTCGWGSKKKHRGGGSRGGRGFAGSFKHKKLWVQKNAPDRLGKYGFKSLRKRALSPSLKAINLRDLEVLAEKEIDVTKLGYDKVLGTGRVTKAVTIKARVFSGSAVKKIEEAGGKAVKLE